MLCYVMLCYDVYTHRDMYWYMYMYNVYVCVYIYIYVYVYTYIHVYIHISVHQRVLDVEEADLAGVVRDA